MITSWKGRRSSAPEAMGECVEGNTIADFVGLGLEIHDGLHVQAASSRP
jgi:hypothetical protein